MTAMTPLVTTTLSTTASQITISSIPQNYKNLYCSFTYANDTANNLFFLRFNNNTAASYSRKGYRSNNTSINPNTAFDDTSLQFAWGTYTGLTPRMNTQFYIYNYSNSTIQKTGTIFSAGAAATGAQSNDSRFSYFYSNTTAITTFTIYNNSGNFNAGSTITVYGLD